MSFKEINQKLPDVTYSKFFTAKNHAKLVGPGLPITPSITRHKMDPIKLDNFLDFITSEHIVRDLPYGERKVRMSNGSVIEMPNVVHSMGASDVIHQYKLFCAENEISPLGDSTMYRIIAQCGAKVRTSLEGIDYFVAEGSRAFSTLSNILEELVQIEVLNLQQSKDATSLLLQCRQYLKTDFKARIVHLSECCEVKDHCLIYALSDPLRPEFSKRCQHNHTYVCVPCEQLKESTSSLLKTVQCAVQENAERTEKLNDLNFKGTQAIQSITNLKNHLVRCKNQDSAKSVLFDTMSEDDVLLICDWSMKYLPKRYREDQTDWFGKRGLPWHITMAFQKVNGMVESLGFVHIFDSQISQDSLTTAAIILDVIDSILKFKDSAKFHLWSDNAGCYKSTEMMSILSKNKKVLSYDFCESQNGKGPCDRTGATLKSAIRRYINQGNDVLNASSMKKGIETMMKSVKYTVSVVEFTSKKEHVKGIPAIGSYSNFSFEEGGIRVWKAHGIGEGLLIKNDQIPAINIRYITVLEEPDDITFHQLPKRNTKSDTENVVIQCTNDGCTEEFSTERELLNHQFVGKCQIEIEFNSGLNSDITKKKYYEKLSESSFLRGVLNLSAETKQMEGSENSLTLGWALKTERKSKRFNKNQKDYLTEKFDKGLKMGRKEDPFNVSESMLHVKNSDGTRRFTYDEILSVQQASNKLLFSNV
ncbi:unnamed protein product [Mytilus coruscus]|uniref:C2H2-type domain-containing protein n=1 Tax=Mytilus coruscus TaxID=42192 RepID=A0A6J8AGK4_MYTCO|nr:unnamed protein product [Mytilus coruscus]